MRQLDDAQLAAVERRLADAGSRLLAGTLVDPAGVTRAKFVPPHRARVFHRAGMGASPSWHVFCIDNAIAFTPQLGVVGDLRLRTDLEALRILGDGLAWAPTQVSTQDGEPSGLCTRKALHDAENALAAQGLTARAGCELEFVVTGGFPHWNAYGPNLGAEPFLADLVDAAETAGLPVEQVHSEYGAGQFEFSLAPASPVEAADDVVLARLLTVRVARRHGLSVSFSPLPFAGDSGNGAHLHLSLARDGVPLLSGGDGPHGLTADGGSAIAGIVAGLPETLAVFAGSVLSAHRLRPDSWSGAHACWGWENREAAVRFCAATVGNPHGASVELKCADPSANPYLALATLLGLALDGVSRRLPLPPEVTRNPSELPDVPRLPDQAAALDAFASSPLARRLLGDQITGALIAVRRHELDTYGKEEIDVLTEKFRFTW
ncbi:glutamine synthetase [Amycolatopsis deserti]|uniref:Glutamine synthetase n=1 Tax=Amycolatopsis deserti TaxID=185696 RepID=A0ABQ3J858_9PSEU|nr:glutamine synthetase family protein [Amycolatopsis deserti]GHF07798.1 glutamine synthetase [Amycolatopsis deserti]